MKFMSSVTVILCLMTACQRTPETPPAATPQPDRQPASRVEVPDVGSEPVASLSGQWRVAGIDGSPFDEPYALALEGDDAQIWWEPRCAGMARAYRIDGFSLSLRPAYVAKAPDVPPPPVCAIALPPRLSELFQALDSSVRIERTAANGILLSGNGRSVLLFSQ